MKIRHNKKRNTAFVFESLVKEITVAILKEDVDRKDKAVMITKKHFHPESELYRHLQCYRSLYENQNLYRSTSEKILQEAKLSNRLIDSEGLFKSQTALINDVNKELDPSVFNNFVPNYKTLATIDQIFSSKLSPKNSVILESQIVENMMKDVDKKESLEPIDELVVTSFVNKFNEKYDTTLMENQKELLNHYISSFADNSLGLKMFLNEEISRLKNRMKEAMLAEEIKEDQAMLEKTEKVCHKLASYKNSGIGEDVVLSILRTQQLEQEIFENGD